MYNIKCAHFFRMENLICTANIFKKKFIRFNSRPSPLSSASIQHTQKKPFRLALCCRFGAQFNFIRLVGRTVIGWLYYFLLRRCWYFGCFVVNTHHCCWLSNFFFFYFSSNLHCFMSSIFVVESCCFFNRTKIS